MEKYFQFGYDQDPFVLFSFEHMMTIMVILLFSIIVVIYRRFLNKKNHRRFFRYGLAILLICSEISFQTWLIYYKVWSISFSMPLHLSSVSLIFTVIMLFTKHEKVFAFVYFAGVGSAIQAIITPVIEPYSFPHFRYIHFYIAHGGVVLACVYMIAIEKYKPTIQLLWKSFLYLNVYTFFVFLVNLLVDGNYMFIMHKPTSASLLDVLGPWPWYILSLEIIALVSFFVLLSPFLIFKDLRSKNSFS